MLVADRRGVGTKWGKGDMVGDMVSDGEGETEGWGLV